MKTREKVAEGTGWGGERGQAIRSLCMTDIEK